MNNISLSIKEKILIVLTGLALPLITVRLELSSISVSMFMACLGLLVFINIKSVTNKIAINKSDILIILFLIVTLFSSLYSENLMYGLAQWIKLATVIIIFVLLRALFTQKPYYLNIIMKYANFSLMIYLIYLSWVYIVKFNQTYIGIETSYVTRSGKNSLAFMAALILPYTLSYFAELIQKKRMKITDMVITAIIFVGSILIQSRALYLLIGMYLIIILVISKISLRLIRTLMMTVLIFVVLFSIFAPPEVVSDLITRFSSLMMLVNDDYVVQGSSSVTGVGSLESRSYLISKGLNMFYEKPIIGNGIGSFRYYGGYASAVSHNDYIQVAAEQGLIGLIIFVSLIVYNLFKSYRISKNNKNDLWVFLAMIGLSFYLIMINAYDSIFFWFLLAIIGSKIRIVRKN